MSSIKKEIKVSLPASIVGLPLTEAILSSRHTYVRARSNWKYTYSI